MEHTTTAHHEEHSGGGVKEIKRVTIILTILTIVELAIGYYMYKANLEESFFRHFLKGVIVILMIWKAYFIVGYFMHLKHENKNLIMTIIVPLSLFIWFIIAFLADGNSYKNLRNEYDASHKERSMQKMEQKEEGHEKHGEEKPEMK